MSEKSIYQIGSKIGSLTIVKEADRTEDGRKRWLCKCDCGNVLSIRSKELNNRLYCSKTCSLYSSKKSPSLIGQKFHKLTVIERSGKNKHGGAIWKCQCDCGNMTNVVTERLKHKTNPTKSCGCLKTSFENLTGQEFGQWVVTDHLGMSESGNRMYLCKCKCGNTRQVSLSSLVTGRSKSCGCLQRDLLARKVTKHSHTTGNKKVQFIGLGRI